jgi:tetratricopeptide (TPR) repeat protein
MGSQGAPEMTTLLILAAFIGASGYDDAFAKANAAYTADKYVEAIQGYEDMLKSGIGDAAVFYNLGNAYYKTGRLGAAIANYERALALNPNLEPARENLVRCVNSTERKMVRPAPPEWKQSLLFWHYGLASATTRSVALATWLVFWLILAVRAWRPVRYLRRTAVSVLVLAVVFGASAWAKGHPEPLAVTDSERAPVYYAPGVEDKPYFELYEGDRVTVDSQQDDWARVTTFDGKRGWAKRDNFVFTGPPYEAAPERVGLGAKPIQAAPMPTAPAGAKP